MRVKDIMGNNRNVKIEDVTMHYEAARGLTFWKKKNGKSIRLVLNEDQERLVKNYNDNVEYFNGTYVKIKKLSDIETS